MTALELKALAYGEDVAFGVFEPGGFCAAAGGYAVGRFYAGHVVVFEFYSARFQFGYFGFYVGDAPIGLAGFGGTGVGRGVEEDFGAAAFVDYASGVFFFWLEADLLFVEFSCAGEVGGGEVGADWGGG